MSMIRRPDTAFSLDRPAKKQRRPAWAERLSEERPNAVSKPCEHCGITMWLPKSKTKRRFCSAECQELERRVVTSLRVRLCETCGSPFVPCHGNVVRGHGRYCSQKCNVAAHVAGNSVEARSKAAASRKRSIAEGKFVPATGFLNHRWKGGQKAYLERRRDSGAAAASLRRYRAANPEKVKEFSRRRNSRKFDKLPYGTIPRIRKMQGGKCAICAVSLKLRWHLDHILPLAKGGRHVPANLQILCQPCNLAKSDRDPIQHMQSLGRLL